jgi:hypothetical protein
MSTGNTLKEKIFYVQKPEFPIFIEKLEMDISRNLIETNNKKENYPTKRGRGRPRKFPIEGQKMAGKIKKIDQYFKNGMKDEEALLSPKSNMIIEDTGISDNSNKQSFRDDDIYDDMSESREYHSENSRQYMEDDTETFSGNLAIDKPAKILDFSRRKGTVCFLIEWEMRSNGIYPTNSYVQHQLFKENFPDFKSDFLNKFNFD